MARTNKNDTREVLRHNWGWLLGLGIVLVFLGFVGLSMVIGLTLVSMYFFAALLIISAVSHFIDIFKHRDWKGIFWQAFIGILYLVAAGVVFYDPFLASSLITALLAGVLIVIGVIRIIMAFSLKEASGWGWFLFAGLISIILGVLILMQWPISGLWVIGMFIAIDMIVNGWTYIFIALSVRASL
ncbi:HdeD protein [Legionella wadsworthii]|uniref:HdeD protein n=1 Tax=Legionella wadsworthii TaxID=28088 RepID=A0A378LM42_9GAMM|nr:HdeD family acid-resistance protein [Legionella wadsworthii]STY28085.1 HdeD protein [Legionella wadsworthii]